MSGRQFLIAPFLINIILFLLNTPPLWYHQTLQQITPLHEKGIWFHKFKSRLKQQYQHKKVKHFNREISKYAFFEHDKKPAVCYKLNSNGHNPNVFFWLFLNSQKQVAIYLIFLKIYYNVYLHKKISNVLHKYDIYKSSNTALPKKKVRLKMSLHSKRDNKAHTIKT